MSEPKNINNSTNKSTNKLKLILYCLGAISLVILGAMIPYFLLGINNLSVVYDQGSDSTEPVSWLELKTYDYKLDKISDSLLTKINSSDIKIVGYAVPLEMSGTRVRHFLLVPSRAYCIHVPPPPPHLMIEVMMEDPISISLLQKAVVISGTLEKTRTMTNYGYASWYLDGKKTYAI